MDRFLIVGAGSIGQRHIRCLLNLGQTAIAALRTKKGASVQLPEDIGAQLDELYSWEEVVSWNPTHLIVSNPTSLHLETVKLGIEQGYRILVEKPFVDEFHTLEKNGQLAGLADYQGTVAYNLRFNDVFQYLKEIIDAQKYGKVWRAELQVGHYLPFWHPNEDYRKSYAAKKSLGGGVLRTLGHELDLSQFMFGNFKWVNANVGRISNLDIDVDDNVDIVLACEACENIVIHLDYINPVPVRQGRFFFEKGLVNYDYFLGEVRFTSYDTQKSVLIFESKEDYNRQYENQMIDFIENSKNGCSFYEGLAVDKLIDACERSSETKCRITL